ncbi:hypothetical protein BH24ACT2_BH24ACT2_09530 [soil metagenome]|jgi:4-amino-4-deoxy-L-arabinose transferase-like glycosyltransferase
MTTRRKQRNKRGPPRAKTRIAPNKGNRRATSKTPAEDGQVERTPSWLRLVVLVGVVAGIALRIRFLTGRAGVIDADEAIVGLLARHILRGEELVGFFWGQGYGGTLEPMLVAFVFALLGPSPGALAVVPTVLSAVAALLVWRIGRRTVGHRAAVVGALAMWLWPAYMVWFSTKEKGFYWVCLAVGLALLLVVLRLVEEPLRDGWWLLLGFLAGVGWWTSPQILYFVLPGVLWLLARQRQEAWRLVLAVPTALIGAAPWLVANFRDDWASFTPANRFNDQGFLGNVWVFLSEGVPVILNLRDAGGWIVDGFFPVLYVAMLAGIAVAVLRRRSGTGLLVLGVIVYVPVYAVFPVSGVVGEGRYLLFLLPFLALLLAHAARRPLAQAALLAAVLALSVVTVPVVEASTVARAGEQRVPTDMGPLLAELDRRGITHLFADFWIAYRVTFESGERIIAAPIGNSRYEPYDRAVIESASPAWLFVDEAALSEQFEIELANRGTPYERFRVGGFVVYQPEERVICWPLPPAPGVACS